MLLDIEADDDRDHPLLDDGQLSSSNDSDADFRRYLEGAQSYYDHPAERISNVSGDSQLFEEKNSIKHLFEWMVSHFNRRGDSEDLQHVRAAVLLLLIIIVPFVIVYHILDSLTEFGDGSSLESRFVPGFSLLSAVLAIVVAQLTGSATLTRFFIIVSTCIMVPLFWGLSLCDAYRNDILRWAALTVCLSHFLNTTTFYWHIVFGYNLVIVLGLNIVQELAVTRDHCTVKYAATLVPILFEPNYKRGVVAGLADCLFLCIIYIVMSSYGSRLQLQKEYLFAEQELQADMIRAIYNVEQQISHADVEAAAEIVQHIQIPTLVEPLKNIVAQVDILLKQLPDDVVLDNYARGGTFDAVDPGAQASDSMDAAAQKPKADRPHHLFPSHRGYTERNITCLAVDLAPITRFVVNMSVDRANKLMKKIFEAFLTIVGAYRGSVTSLGFGICLATWNTRSAFLGHETAACLCALGLRRRLERLIKEFPHFERPINISIATGCALVGNIEAANKMSFSVIGDAVDRALSMLSISVHDDDSGVGGETKVSAYNLFGGYAQKLIAKTSAYAPASPAEFPTISRKRIMVLVDDVVRLKVECIIAKNHILQVLPWPASQASKNGGTLPTRNGLLSEPNLNGPSHRNRHHESAGDRLARRGSVVQGDAFVFTELFDFHKSARWEAQSTQLGTGMSSQVYLGHDTHSPDQVVALKQFKIQLDFMHKDGNVDTEAEAQLAHYASEIALMTGISHPNLLKVIGCQIINHKLTVALEFARVGTLSGLISRKGLPPVAMLLKWAQEMASGLEYLHKNFISHNDLKPNNVLLDIDPSGYVAKLSDFGSASTEVPLFTAVGEPKEQRQLLEGTPPYMSPQAVKGKSENASDIWAYGLTVLFIATGDRPWQKLGNVNQNLIMNEIIKLEGKPYPLPDDLPPFLSQFLTPMLQFEGRNRPTATQILNDPIFDIDKATLAAYGRDLNDYRKKHDKLIADWKAMQQDFHGFDPTLKDPTGPVFEECNSDGPHSVGQDDLDEPVLPAGRAAEGTVPGDLHHFQFGSKDPSTDPSTPNSPMAPPMGPVTPPQVIEDSSEAVVLQISRPQGLRRRSDELDV